MQTQPILNTIQTNALQMRTIHSQVTKHTRLQPNNIFGLYVSQTWLKLNNNNKKIILVFWLHFHVTSKSECG